MKMVELPESRILSIWDSFGKAVGSDVLKKMYGDYWPRHPVYKERVWIAAEDEDILGWISLRPDPVEPIVWMALGIWPRYQRSGNSRELFRWGIKKSFEICPKSEAMFYAVSNSDPGYISYIKGAGKASLVGGVDFPEPGFTYFAIKKRGL